MRISDCGLKKTGAGGLSVHIPQSEIRNKAGGSSSVGRASAFQAEGREFEPRLPLQFLEMLARLPGPSSSGVEHLLGKEGVTSSNLVSGSSFIADKLNLRLYT